MWACVAKMDLVNGPNSFEERCTFRMNWIVENLKILNIWLGGTLCGSIEWWEMHNVWTYEQLRWVEWEAHFKSRFCDHNVFNLMIWSKDQVLNSQDLFPNEDTVLPSILLLGYSQSHYHHWWSWSYNMNERYSTWVMN
jgi:hypothetical protein